jgi:hypothetical protein
VSTLLLSEKTGSNVLIICFSPLLLMKKIDPITLHVLTLHVILPVLSISCCIFNLTALKIWKSSGYWKNPGSNILQQNYHLNLPNLVNLKRINIALNWDKIINCMCLTILISIYGCYRDCHFDISFLYFHKLLAWRITSLNTTVNHSESGHVYHLVSGEFFINSYQISKEIF